MSKKYMIGLDSGTSGIKAVLFDTEGNQLAKEGYPLEAICKYENWFEEDVNEIWEKAQKAISAVAAKCPKKDIIGIGITAQGDGLWMFDKNMEPTRNGCCFCDGRGFAELEAWVADGTVDKAFELSGNRLFTGNQPVILKWMDKHEPDTLARTRYMMHLKDYLYYKLTGVVCTDSTDQSLVFINMNTREYDDQLFKLYGLGKYRDRYPKIVESLDSAQPISVGLAEALGLPESTLVTNGPMDVAACAIGAGVVGDGDCCSIIGTAAIHEMVINKPYSDHTVAGLTLTHAVEGRCLRLMASMAGTPNLEWFLTLFERDALKQKAQASGKELYKYIEEEIAKVPIGARGIIYHPYLLAGGERAPFTDGNARASLTGLSVTHNSMDVMRACYEGVAYAMMHCYDNMPFEIGKITICGGGAASEVWCQMFADALGKQVITVNGDELGAKGAILTNAVAQGIYKDLKEAVEKTVTLDKTYEPNMANHEKYLKYFGLYKKIYELISQTWKMRYEILSETMDGE
jgi:sugar (pentulose or hexulose) kinase